MMNNRFIIDKSFFAALLSPAGDLIQRRHTSSLAALCCLHLFYDATTCISPSYTHEARKGLLPFSCFLYKVSANGIKRKLLHFNAFYVLNKSGGEVL